MMTKKRREEALQEFLKTVPREVWKNIKDFVRCPYDKTCGMVDSIPHGGVYGGMIGGPRKCQHCTTRRCLQQLLNATTTVK